MFVFTTDKYTPKETNMEEFFWTRQRREEEEAVTEHKLMLC